MGNSTKLTDDSLMPWGIHKGTIMRNVPDQYLMWLSQVGTKDESVSDYIEDNLDAIKNNLK